MTNTTVVPNSFTVAANVFAVMTAKTAGRSQMADIVRMCLPICFHLGKEIHLVDPLYFFDRSIDLVTLF